MTKHRYLQNQDEQPKQHRRGITQLNPAAASTFFQPPTFFNAPQRLRQSSAAPSIGATTSQPIPVARGARTDMPSLQRGRSLLSDALGSGHTSSNNPLFMSSTNPLNRTYTNYNSRR